MTIKYVIFDWSGTSSDALTPVYQQVMRIFRRLGLREMTIDEFRERIAFIFIHFYNFVIKMFNLELDKIFFKIIHSEIKAKPKPFPGIIEVFKYLNSKGIKLVILSYHLQKELETDLADWEIGTLFIEKKGSVKSKRFAIKKIIENNNFIPEQTVFVGDMVIDIHAGKKAGTKTIAATYGFESKRRLLAAKPDFVIDNPTDIKRIIS